MKENWPLLIWWALISLAGNLPTVASWMMPALTSSEWAAWVQAVGSVAAILASVLVAVLLPAHQEAETQKARQARLLLAILHSARELSGFAAAAQQILQSGKVNNGTYQHLAASVRATEYDLKAINTVEIPGTARIYLIAARAKTNLILMLLDHAHASLGAGTAVDPDYFDEVLEATIEDERKIRAYIASRPIGQTPLPGYH